MKKYVMFLTIAALAAVLAVGVAACGGGGSSSSSESSSPSEPAEEGGSGGGGSEGEGKEGGSMTAAWTNFPDYMDPQISYTAQGWTAMRNGLHPDALLQIG